MPSPARTVAVSLLLAAATVAVYFSVVHHPFLNLDDNQYVTANLHVQDGLTWPTVRWAFTSYDAFNWHPLTWLSHALDVQVFGLDPGGHHAINLVLHSLNVILLFLVLQRATGYTGRSAMVAALFALHPINVESVAWIAERKNVLSMMFFLLALGSYGRYARKPSIARYGIVALCFALGLMAKPQVITLPFVLLLWDYWPLQRVDSPFRSSPFAVRQSAADDISGEKQPAKSALRFLLLEKAPLFVLCAASSVLTMQAQRAGGALASFVKYPFAVRVANAVVAYAKYLGRAFWPAKLSLMYPHPGASLRGWQVWLALLLLLGITELTIQFRSRRYLLVGWLWFLGTMVPMIGIVQVGHQAMADRYAYLPFVGLFIMVCWGVADVFSGMRSSQAIDIRKRNVGEKRWKGAASAVPRAANHEVGFSPGEVGSPTEGRTWGTAFAVSAIVLLALATVTHRQLHYWSDNLLLWSHVSQVIGPNLISEDRMGDELLSRSRPAEAMDHYHRAIAIKPSDLDSNFALGVYEQKQGNLHEAIQRYSVVVSNTTDPHMRARALTYMSYAYRALGDLEKASQSLHAAGDPR